MYVGAGDKDMGIRSEGRRGVEWDGNGLLLLNVYYLRQIFILFIKKRRRAKSGAKDGGIKETTIMQITYILPV